MPLIKPASNPIMNMQNEIKWIETIQGIFVLSVGVCEHFRENLRGADVAETADDRYAQVYEYVYQ